jgi:bifunctional non-homologous end joining protein LigD
VVQVAQHLVRELHDLELTTVVLSSGSKGIHVAMPLDGTVDFERSKEFARSMAQRLAATHPDLVVVTMAKAERKGRVLVDWSQNARHKSTVSVYSLRARPSPTAAFPLLPGELDRLAAGDLDVERLLLSPGEVLARIDEHGDPAELLVSGPGHELPEPEPLATYRSMRRFDETPEPAGRSAGPPAPSAPGDRPRFVIQEHHATSLHWDLRLEHGGVLVSFAVPKGLPWSPDEDHLAVHTEDHPLEYLHFTGDIPDGSYGAGRMSIWDEGTYEPEEMADDKFKFVLHGRRVEGRYAIFPWKGRNWMVHRMDPPQDPTRSALPTDLRPMRPRSGRVPVGKAWSHELCWPGCRVLVASAGGRASVQDSTGNDVSAAVPEVRRVGDALGSTEVVLDGVLVALDDDGAPTADAEGVRARLAAGEDRRGRRRPRVAVMLFDLLWLDGHSHLDDPLKERRRLLTGLQLDGPGWQTPAASRVPPADLLAAARSRGFGALVAKRLDSPYRPGEESDDWIVGDQVAKR